MLQLKGVLMAIYFGADHVVWAGQAGLVSNKQTLERYSHPEKSSVVLICSLALYGGAFLSVTVVRTPV